MTRPDASEFDSYFAPYIDRVPGSDVVAVLRAQLDAVATVFESAPAAARGRGYEEGKWTMEEVFAHVVDSERVFSTRALMFARGHDDIAQPGMDQDVMIDHARATERGIEAIAAEFRALRTANLFLFEAFDAAAWSRSGLASGVPMSVRALVYLIAGHADHHVEVVQQRYLPATAQKSSRNDRP